MERCSNTCGRRGCGYNMSGYRRCILLNRHELLPDAWWQSPEQPLRTFNPSILAAPAADDARWLLAYRVVGERERRQIACCRMDENFQVIPGSQTPFSDLLSETCAAGNTIRSWYADPRLYRIAGRYFIYWNSGWHEPQNQQFLQEFDPGTFHPIGRPRELVLQGARQKLEKNWMLFGDGTLYAVYSAAPHRVLQGSLDNERLIEFREISNISWETEAGLGTFGFLRGGAPPIRIGDRYYSVGHSLRELPAGLHYAAVAYTFDAAPPFAPLEGPSSELILGNPYGAKTIFPRLNQAVYQVIYPCGAAPLGECLVVSYGINDEHCALSIFARSELPLVSITEPARKEILWERAA